MSPVEEVSAQSSHARGALLGPAHALARETSAPRAVCRMVHALEVRIEVVRVQADDFASFGPLGRRVLERPGAAGAACRANFDSDRPNEGAGAQQRIARSPNDRTSTFVPLTNAGTQRRHRR